MLLVVLLLLTNAYTPLPPQRTERAGGSRARSWALFRRENVTTMLETMLAQYDTLETENVQIEAEMEAQQEKSPDRWTRRGKGTSTSCARRPKPCGSIMKGYVATIDSLNQVEPGAHGRVSSGSPSSWGGEWQKDALESKAQDLEGRMAQGSCCIPRRYRAGALFVRLTHDKQVETDGAHRKADDNAASPWVRTR